MSGFVGHVHADSSGEVWGRQGRAAYSEGEEGKKQRFSVGERGQWSLQIVEKRVEGEKLLSSPAGSLCGEPYEIPVAPRPACGRVVRTDDFGWMQTEGGRN